MMSRSHVRRAWILGAVLVLGAIGLARTSKAEPALLRAPLADLPMMLAGWTGSRLSDLESNVLAVLGVDDYINRSYRATSGGPPVGLYIGYYQSQRQGQSIHSPLNCLPGSGWQPVKNGHVTFNAGGTQVEINRYVVQKAGESLLVLYWYQSHGRIIASEYWGKLYMVYDSVRLNRTDAALVRVVVPIGGADEAGEVAAERLGLGFVQAMFPLLGRHLPV